MERDIGSESNISLSKSLLECAKGEMLRFHTRHYGTDFEYAIVKWPDFMQDMTAQILQGWVDGILFNSINHNR